MQSGSCRDGLRSLGRAGPTRPNSARTPRERGPPGDALQDLTDRFRELSLIQRLECWALVESGLQELDVVTVADLSKVRVLHGPVPGVALDIPHQAVRQVAASTL